LKTLFSSEKSDLAKIVVNFTDSKMCFLAKVVDSRNKFLNAKRLLPYYNRHRKISLLMSAPLTV